MDEDNESPREGRSEAVTEDESVGKENGSVFTAADELHWHQFDLLRRILPRSEKVQQGVDEIEGERPISDGWGLSDELEPYPWQEAALEAWESNGRSGVVKVVTGAGKTVLALMCLERLLREDEAIRVSVVVPTRVLLDQWYDELTGTLGLPTTWVGRRSGEYKDRFMEGCRVMIYVINSARTALGNPLSDEKLAARHFLIVDECHRAGSSENQKIFDVPRRFALGLSATPERDIESVDTDTPEDDVSDKVREELGPIIFELTFQQALEEGIVPPFEIIHCAVDLTPRERKTYDKLSRELRDLRDQLRQEPAYVKGKSRVPNEFRLIKSLARRDDSRAGKLASRYEALTTKRKELLYRAENRRLCFRSILEEEREEGDIRIMAFHERISEVDRLFEPLVRDGVPVVLDHTGLTETQRERSLDLYLRGFAPVLLSVKALIEGVNAPATDVGVIVAASASPRQKIQSLGRVMRRYPGKKTSRIYNIYVGDSADENIFRRMSFEEILGADRVEYRKWLDAGRWEVLDGPPYAPLPSDSDLEEETLELGEPYPGEESGLELSLDTQGNVYRDSWEEGRRTRDFLVIPSEVLDAIRDIREGGGPIRITERRNHVLVPARNVEGDWDLFYAGRLSPPLKWAERSEERIKLKISGHHGGSVVVNGGPEKRYDVRSPGAKKILKLVRSFQQEQAETVHKVELSPDGSVFARVEGREYRLGALAPEDGWPLGKGSFDDLRKEIYDDS